MSGLSWKYLSWESLDFVIVTAWLIQNTKGNINQLRKKMFWRVMTVSVQLSADGSEVH